MPATGDDALRERLYSAYASTHAGIADPATTTLIFQHEIAPLISGDSRTRIVDVGCGQGTLVGACLAAGYTRTTGIDISPEQVSLARDAGLGEAVGLGDFRTLLGSRPGSADVVLATDVLEHHNRSELLAAMDSIRVALAPAGVLIARVPNAGSPFGGLIRHGDLTHESWFTPRSLAQLCRATGFAAPEVFPCPPVAHGLKSRLRSVAWSLASSGIKAALAAETGVLRGHIVTQNMTFRARVSP
ncbi:MAG: class I SAM-dependent methyltransferase [Actinobacteria bacterium]|nr:class I SAM-dependent methyltransferase [Actinomycetota bacterium]